MPVQVSSYTLFRNAASVQKQKRAQQLLPHNLICATEAGTIVMECQARHAAVKMYMS